MTTNDHENFEELEIHHNRKTYYATGYVEYTITESIGGNYEGYAFERVYERELNHVTITDLWYYDQDTGNSVDMLYQSNYREVQKIAEEMVRWEFE